MRRQTPPRSSSSCLPQARYACTLSRRALPVWVHDHAGSADGNASSTTPYECPVESFYQRTGTQLCVISQASGAWSGCSTACSAPEMQATDASSIWGPWGMVSVLSEEEQAWLHGVMVERAAAVMPLGGSAEEGVERVL